MIQVCYKEQNKKHALIPTGHC